MGLNSTRFSLGYPFALFACPQLSRTSTAWTVRFCSEMASFFRLLTSKLRNFGDPGKCIALSGLCARPYPLGLDIGSYFSRRDNGSHKMNDRVIVKEIAFAA
jgi:hypothetical protein